MWTRKVSVVYRSKRAEETECSETEGDGLLMNDQKGKGLAAKYIPFTTKW